MTDYSKRIEKIVEMFKDDKIYKSCINDDDYLTEWRLYRKYSKKVLDTKWISVIEDSLESLDTIVRNPRRFIVVEEDLIDTSRARQVTEESVKFLAQHTNYITGFDGDMILPSKLLNSTKEESYEVYENRFIYTLLKRLQMFVRKRYDVVKGAAAKNEQIEVVIDKKMNVGNASISFRLDSILKMPFEEALKLNAEELGPVERLARINAIVTGFMVTPFAKEMVSSEPVRPPIQRTNAILKNQNLKKALALWEFLQGYEEEGYEIREVTESEELSEELKNQYRLVAFFNSLFMQSAAGENFTVKGPAAKRRRILDVDPNEFPKSDVPFDEVKYISVPSQYDRYINEIDKTVINSAIDRVIAQEKLNRTNAESKSYDKQVALILKNERDYREKMLKLRQRERVALEREAKLKEREKIREENELKRLEVERARREKLQKIEEKKTKEVQARLDAEMKRLDEEAVNLAVMETRTEQVNLNRSKTAKEIIALNTLRGKVKAELAKYVDEQFDDMIKLVQKLFNNNV